MTKLDKLKARILRKPVDFTFRELCTLLGSMGYRIDQKGHSSGSRVLFFNVQTRHTIILHKPHPGKILKQYQVNFIVNELIEQGLL